MKIRDSPRSSIHGSFVFVCRELLIIHVIINHIKSKSEHGRDIDTGVVGIFRDEIAIHIGIKSMGYGTSDTQSVVVSNSAKKIIMSVCTSSRK